MTSATVTPYEGACPASAQGGPGQFPGQGAQLGMPGQVGMPGQLGMPGQFAGAQGQVGTLGQFGMPGQVGIPGQFPGQVGMPGPFGSQFGMPGQLGSQFGMPGQLGSQFGMPGQFPAALGMPGQFSAALGMPGQFASAQGQGGTLGTLGQLGSQFGMPGQFAGAQGQIAGQQPAGIYQQPGQPAQPCSAQQYSAPAEGEDNGAQNEEPVEEESSIIYILDFSDANLRYLGRTNEHLALQDKKQLWEFISNGENELIGTLGLQGSNLFLASNAPNGLSEVPETFVIHQVNNTDEPSYSEISTPDGKYLQRNLRFAGGAGARLKVLFGAQEGCRTCPEAVVIFANRRPSRCVLL